MDTQTTERVRFIDDPWTRDWTVIVAAAFGLILFGAGAAQAGHLVGPLLDGALTFVLWWLILATARWAGRHFMRWQNSEPPPSPW